MAEPNTDTVPSGRPRLRARSAEALDWYNSVTAVPGAVIGLLYLAVLIVPVATGWQPAGGVVVRIVNQGCTLLFAADYFLRLWLAPDRSRFFVKHLFDLLVIAVPALRPLRAMRSLDLFPGSRAGTAVTVVGTAVVLVLVGAVYEYYAESGAPGSTIANYGDAVWWAIVTVTTVGYGDFYPVTVVGRIIAVGLMMMGIAIIGTITATVASSFMNSLQRRRSTPREEGEGAEGLERGFEDQDVTMIDLSDQLRRVQAELAGLRRVEAELAGLRALVAGLGTRPPDSSPGPPS